MSLHFDSHPPSPSAISFRKDINGLRAWAVLAVVLYHFDWLSVNGGFFGVDVFFVISGYLMTAILMTSFENHRFGLFGFYLSRLRRVLPALLAVVLTVLLLGWWLLPNSDYLRLGTEGVWAVLMSSNVHFAGESGYFAPQAYEQLLLHTWSLGLEAQYYVIYPLLLWGIWHFFKTRTALLWWHAGLAVLSFFVAIYGASEFSQWTFYSLPTRFWEFSIGSLVFLLGWRTISVNDWFQGKRGLLGAWLGILTLIAIFALLPASQSWSPVWAVVPVLATGLVILSASQLFLTNAKPFQWLGERSYSIYLWHWPMVAYLSMTHWLEWRWAALLLTLFLAHLTFGWVENPSRRSLAIWPKRRQWLALLVGVLLVAGLAKVVTANDFEGRIPDSAREAASGADHISQKAKQCLEAATAEGAPGCEFGTGDKLLAVVVGDSHGAYLMEALGEVASEHNGKVLFLGMVACPTIFDMQYEPHFINPPNVCRDFNDWLWQRLQQIPPDVPIVWVNRTAGYFWGPNEVKTSELKDRPWVFFDQHFSSVHEADFVRQFQSHLTRSLCRLAEKHTVFALLPTPEMKLNVPQTMGRRLMVTEEVPKVILSKADYLKRITPVVHAEKVAAEQCGVQLLDPAPFFCDDRLCYSSSEEGTWYFDDDHLNLDGSRRLKPLLEKMFEASDILVSNSEDRHEPTK